MTQRGVLATMQVLDVYGPLEMFACKPAQAHFDVVFVAERAGEVASAQKAVTVAEHDFASCPPLDILLVPGKHELCCIAVTLFTMFASPARQAVGAGYAFHRKKVSPHMRATLLRLGKPSALLPVGRIAAHV